MSQWEQAYGARLDASYREDTFFPAQRLENQTKLDILAGDFVAAEKNAREAVRLRSSSTLLRDHNAPMVSLLEILLETGKTELAGQTAKDHLARSAAWEPSARGVDYYKSSFLVYAHAGGQMTDAEYRKQRDAWVEEASTVMTTPLTGHQDIWYNTYAFAAQDAASSREALAVLPHYQPLPWLVSTKTDFALTGRTYLLAGETAEAIRWLERASHHCSVYSEPLWHMRAHLWLGQAREQQGDKENACAAYKVVLEHWGHAKPKSVTADAAAARFHALACGK
jgi:serine/threonine-protein kinase